MRWDLFFHPFSVLVGLVLVVAIGLLLRKTSRDDDVLFETSMPWFTVGRARISAGVALILAIIAGSAIAYPPIETARNDELLNSRNDTIAELSKQVSNKDAKIKELEAEIEEMKSSASQNSLLITSLNNELKKLTGELEREKKAREDAEDALGKSNQTIVRTEAEATRLRDKLNRDKIFFEDVISAERRALESAKQRNASLEQQLTDTLILLRERGLSQEDKNFITGAAESIQSLNEDLKFVQIRRVPTPVVGNNADWPMFEVLSRQGPLSSQPGRGAGLFSFFEQSYQFEGLYGADDFADAISEDINGIARELCRAVSTALSGSAETEEIFEQTEVWQKFTEDRSFIGRVVETEYLMQRLMADYSSVEFYATGYADGETAAWQEDLPNDLSAGIVHLRDTSRNRPDQFVEYYLEQTASVPLGIQENGSQVYGNAQLPNLRGHQTRSLLNSFAHACTGPGFDRTIGEVGQLEGVVFDDISKNDRKSRVHFRIRPRQ